MGRPRPASDAARIEAEIGARPKEEIARIHRDACGRYGSPRIHRELKDQGRGG